MSGSSTVSSVSSAISPNALTKTAVAAVGTLAAGIAYGSLIERLADSDFYRTFYNSVTRDLFGTVGVNPAVEFCATQDFEVTSTQPILVEQYMVGQNVTGARR